MADDPEGGVSEWEAEFRTDIAAFLADADIDACVDHDRPSELPPRSGIVYQAFVDPAAVATTISPWPSGTSRVTAPSSTWCAGTPPFDPKLGRWGVSRACLREYRLREVDRRQLYRRLGERSSRPPASNTCGPRCRRGGCTSKGCRPSPAALWPARSSPLCCASCGCWSAAFTWAARTPWITAAPAATTTPTRYSALIAVAQKKKPKLRMGVYMIGGGQRSELDPQTGRPLERDRLRIRWVTIDEVHCPSCKRF